MSCHSLDTAYCRISPHLLEGVPSSLGWWVQACDGNQLSSAHFLASASRAPISWWSFVQPGGCTWHLLTCHQNSYCLSFLPPSPLLPFAPCLRLASWGVPFFIPCDPIASSTFCSAWSPQWLWHYIFLFFIFIFLFGLSVCIAGECCECVCVVWRSCVCGSVHTCIHLRSRGGHWVLCFILSCLALGRLSLPHFTLGGGVLYPIYLGGVSLPHLTLKWASLPCLILRLVVSH